MASIVDVKAFIEAALGLATAAVTLACASAHEAGGKVRWARAMGLRGAEREEGRGGLLLPLASARSSKSRKRRRGRHMASWMMLRGEDGRTASMVPIARQQQVGRGAASAAAAGHGHGAPPRERKREREREMGETERAGKGRGRQKRKG